MGTKITKKQKLIINFLEEYSACHDESPSYREIASGVGLSSVASVAEHVENLVEKGVLKKVPGAARSLEIMDYEHRDCIELFERRLMTANADETKVLLAALDLLGLELPEE